MTDPVRFADEHSSALVRSLLVAAEEEPPAVLLRRTLTSIAAGGATLAVSMPASAAGVKGAAATAAGGVAATSSMLAATALKCMGIGAVAGALVTGGALKLAATPPSTPMPHAIGAAQPMKASAQPERPAPAKPEQAPSTEVLPAAAPLPASTQAREDSAEQRRAALLRAEAVLIDEAREAVATGNADRALRALEAHELRFDEPLFLPEALYLRMQALRLRGNDRAAVQVAKRLLVAYPNGPRAASARAFLKAAQP